TLVDETARLNHESIAFPSSDRVSIPPRLGVGAGQGPAVHEYLAKSVICFIHDDDQLRSLDDLAGLGMIVELHDAHREAMRVGMVLTVVRLPFFHKLGSPGPDGQAALHSRSNVAKQVHPGIG